MATRSTTANRRLADGVLTAVRDHGQHARPGRVVLLQDKDMFS